MKYFTHYWNRVENQQYEGQTLDRIASNQFRRRGVEFGDIVFCVSRIEGQLGLVGRLVVAKIVDGETAQRESDQSQAFGERSDHCLAKEGSGTLISFTRIVPFEVAKKLLFNGKPLTVDAQDDTLWDRQTLRGIRQLNLSSAVILNQTIDNELPIADASDSEPVEVEEGRRVAAYHIRLERDATIVGVKKAEVFEASGRLACECCGFDFFAFYGEVGHGFAECHHRVWLSTTPPETFHLTSTADLAIVCSNCHRMLHRDRQLTVEILRRQVERSR